MEQRAWSPDTSTERWDSYAPMRDLPDHYSPPDSDEVIVIPHAGTPENKQSQRICSALSKRVGDSYCALGLAA